MKIKCVDKKHYCDLTEGKVYDIYYESFGKQYYVKKDDNEDAYFYDKDCFIVICENDEELELENRITLLEEQIKTKEEELKKLIEYRNKNKI